MLEDQRSFTGFTSIDDSEVTAGKPLSEEELKKVRERLMPPSVETVPDHVVPWSKEFLAKIRAAYQREKDPSTTFWINAP